ncbi:helix-turn-helix transcriptional regulator [Clostridium gasigenes]|uniref:helix-turn-helix domain-containing protein n=1 Tax=Clostridium gasigenes TaxID=94869 RepID=UPI001628C946|nr:helix-turn-helix transcriptional regulator [Clostridium gasigenes]MBB6622070.1 helix-turn-helix transcriptional regulator [Clostridium gasigenes]
MFSKKIKEYRIELGFTQEEFSKRIGISRSTLGNLESGLRAPSKQVLEKISLLSNKNINWWIDINEFSKLSLLLDYTFKVGLIKEDGVVKEEERQHIWGMLNEEIERGEMGNLTICQIVKLSKILCVDIDELLKILIQQMHYEEM